MKVRLRKGKPVFKDFMPHPGIEVAIVPPRVMKAFAKQYYGEQSPMTYKALLARIPLVSKTGEKVRQKFLFITRKTKPRMIAHEAGHLRLGHLDSPPRSAKEYIEEELLAWAYSGVPYITLADLLDIGSHVREVYKLTPSEIVDLLASTMRKLNFRPLNEDEANVLKEALK